MARIVVERLVEHLERSGFVIIKKPPSAGGATIGRGLSICRNRSVQPENITRHTLVGYFIDIRFDSFPISAHMTVGDCGRRG
jgi:hypothetical protein